MIVLRKIGLSLMMFISLVEAHGQHTVFYSGLGRAEISKDVMNEEAEFLKDDSTSDKRDLNGRFIFDLGVNVEPNDKLRALALLRVTNEFGGFYSQGSALEFRQIKIEGLIGDKVNYQIGDIDLKLTEYTLINNQEIYNEFESDIFSIRREVTSYENFNVDDYWRLQGLQTNGTLLFDRVLQSADLNVFGTRIRKNDYSTTPDRIMGGGSINLKQSDRIEIGGNLLAISDVVGTVPDTTVDYSNTVLTGDYRVGVISKENIGLDLVGEVGIGYYDYHKIAADQRQRSDDYFYDLGLKGKYKDFNFSADYRYVGPRYYSPGAQTMRLDNSLSPSLFPTGLGGATNRAVGLYDRFADLNLYNQSISPTLMTIASQYNNVTPYGKATPNRQGLTVNVSKGNRDSTYYAALTSNILTEAIGVGQQEKRNFFALYGGTKVALNKLIGTDQNFDVKLGFKMESTTRAGAAEVDLNSFLFDAGVSYELVNKLDLVVGYKSLKASGREFSSEWNDFNEIQVYGVNDLDISETIMGVGLRYRFSKYNFFTINANRISVKDNEVPDMTYDFGQVYCNYTLVL